MMSHVNLPRFHKEEEPIVALWQYLEKIDKFSFPNKERKKYAPPHLHCLLDHLCQCGVPGLDPLVVELYVARGQEAQEEVGGGGVHRAELGGVHDLKKAARDR